MRGAGRRAGSVVGSQEDARSGGRVASPRFIPFKKKIQTWWSWKIKRERERPRSEWVNEGRNEWREEGMKEGRKTSSQTRPAAASSRKITAARAWLNRTPATRSIAADQPRATADRRGGCGCGWRDPWPPTNQDVLCNLPKWI